MPARRSATLKLSLQILDPRPVALHNLLDMRNPVKVHLQLVQLPEQRVVPRNLRVRPVNDVPSVVILELREHLRLLAKVPDVLLDAGHEAVEVATKRGEGRAVEEQEALTAGAAGGAGAAGSVGEGCLALSQDLDFLGGEP